MSVFHEPVLAEEVLSFLPRPEGAVYVDGTVGGGGHALRILEESAPDARLIGIDRDDDALGESEKRLRTFRGRVVLVRGDFADMETVLRDLGIGKVDGILLDLGVSSHQLEHAGRGFGFSQRGPLDMRMDRRGGQTAFDLVHGLSEEDLRDLLYRYGEEGEARGSRGPSWRGGENRPSRAPPTLPRSFPGPCPRGEGTGGDIPPRRPSRPFGSP